MLWAYDYGGPTEIKDRERASFLTAIHTAKGIGKQEGVSEIFACK
jgi:hypothetical protein